MSARGSFIAPLVDLDVAERDFEFTVTPAWLRGALEGCEMQPAGPDGSLKVHLTKTGRNVLVQGQVDVELVVSCARCLAPVSLRPRIELALLLEPAPAGAHGGRSAGEGGARDGARNASRPAGGRDTRARRPSEDEDETFAAEEAGVDTYDGDELVLDRFIREAVLLESPIFPLCSEACEGIRPASDSAPPPPGEWTDPRLLPLVELAKKRKMKE